MTLFEHEPLPEPKKETMKKIQQDLDDKRLKNSTYLPIDWV
jgi:hypothetical protein